MRSTGGDDVVGACGDNNINNQQTPLGPGGVEIAAAGRQDEREGWDGMVGHQTKLEDIERLKEACGMQDPMQCD
jgi:hypothetical protein